jgi:hypothetical protein
MDTDLPVVGEGAVEGAAPVEVAPPVPVPEAAPVPVPPPVVEAVVVEDSNPPVLHRYPSLYDTKSTTVLAILLGIAIVGGIQYMVQKIFLSNKNEHKALTQFVTSMVALVIGAYIADLLIAGPDTSLLSDDEHTIILGFIKDICLMVFAFYFGTKTAPAPKESD